MKKSLSIILIIALALSSAFAGGASESNANEVYFLNFKPEIADVYTDIVAPAFEEETGLSLRVVTAASNQYQTTLRSEMAKSNPPVIFQVNGPVGVQAFTNDVAPLEDTGFYALLADKSMAIEQDGHVVGIPYAVEGYGIIYNDAIMRKYFALPDKAVDISSADEIRNFATLKAVVEDMTKHLDELGIKGVFASTSMASGTDWRWQTHLFNMPLWKEFGDILTTTEASTFEFTYNENYKALWDLYLDNSTTAKGMANGFPIGGVLISPAIKPEYGMLGTTFGGNHLACAAALAVLDVIENEHLIENAARVGEHFRQAFNGPSGLDPALADYRGKGLMIGLELKDEFVGLRDRLLFERHFFTGAAGPKVIRLLPSLTISIETADRFIRSWKELTTTDN